MAHSGPAALEMAAEFRPDVAFLDIGLPEMDGYELAHQLRTNPASQQAVLVALTDYGQAHHRAMGKAAGFDHYYVKPIQMSQLTKILAKLNA